MCRKQRETQMYFKMDNDSEKYKLSYDILKYNLVYTYIFPL